MLHAEFRLLANEWISTQTDAGDRVARFNEPQSMACYNVTPPRLILGIEQDMFMVIRFASLLDWFGNRSVHSRQSVIQRSFKFEIVVGHARVAKRFLPNARELAYRPGGHSESGGPSSLKRVTGLFDLRQLWLRVLEQLANSGRSGRSGSIFKFGEKLTASG